jgi:energy-coupling factor transport system ATP-binding protein
MNEYSIVVKNLDYYYKKPEKILDNISLKINKGEFVSIVGKNGSGKTTLVKHFNGLLKPKSGSVCINNIDTKKSNISKLAKTVGFVFQNPDHQIFHDTVEKEAAYGPKNLGIEKEELEKRVHDALQEVDLLKYKLCSPYHLSKGERQRVALASVLAMKTKIIILDEPTTGQDYREAEKIMKILKKLNNEGHIIIIVTHDMELTAGYAERVIVLSEGKIIADDNTKNIFSSRKLLEKAYLQPPQINSLAGLLANYGCPNNILTVNEMYEWFANYGE